jgi:hypothetical protein
MVADNNLQQANALQAKFEFFMLGLTFASLSIFLQTVPIYIQTWVAVIEALSWLLLLLSGTLGIYRVLWAPVILTHYAEKNNHLDKAGQLKRLKLQRGALLDQGSGDVLDLEEVIKAYEGAAEGHESRATSLNERIGKMHVFQLGLLILGFFLVGFSRAYKLLSI